MEIGSALVITFIIFLHLKERVAKSRNPSSLLYQVFNKISKIFQNSHKYSLYFKADFIKLTKGIAMRTS